MVLVCKEVQIKGQVFRGIAAQTGTKSGGIRAVLNCRRDPATALEVTRDQNLRKVGLAGAVGA